MQNLELAKKTLVERGLTLAVACDGEVIFESELHGVSGFLDAVKGLGGRLRRASVADRVVGKAVALLCVFAGVKDVYAVTLGITAKKVFDENGIGYEYEHLVDSILNADRSRACVFERVVTDVSDAEEAFVRLKRLRDELAEGLPNNAKPIKS